MIPRWVSCSMPDYRIEIEVKEYLQNLQYAFQHATPTTFIMSFHFAEKPFTSDIFPYRKPED